MAEAPVTSTAAPTFGKLVLFDGAYGICEERVHLRSAAVVAVLRALGRPPFWTHMLAVLPRPLAELGYALFARVRYRLFGEFDECRVPSPEESMRFLY